MVGLGREKKAESKVDEKEALKRFRLPWDEFRKKYNEDQGTDFETVAEWIVHLRKRHGSFCNISRALNVFSETSLYNVAVAVGVHNPSKKAKGGIKKYGE